LSIKIVPFPKYSGRLLQVILTGELVSFMLHATLPFYRTNLFIAAFAWLKCEKEEDKNCFEVLKTSNIIGREGSLFGAESRFVRLSLVQSQDDFDLLLQRMETLVVLEEK
jgi:hypothetical protein